MGEAQVLPPGFRFHPTDEELVTYYLLKKVLDSSFTGRAITEVDLNKCEPWHLPEKAKIGEKEWYFFSLRDRKYPTGLRTNRATEAGYWKATGKDREIFSSRTRLLVGMKKTLVFYRGRAPKGEKSNWVMHEYRLEGKLSYHRLSKTVKDEWVISRVFQKSGGGKKSFLSEFQRNSLYLGLLPPLTAAGDAGNGSDETSLGKPASEHVPCFSTINTENSNFNPNFIPPSNYRSEAMLPIPSFPLTEESIQFPFLLSTTVPAPAINEFSVPAPVCFSMEPATLSGFRSSAILRAMMDIDSVPIQKPIASGFDGYNVSEPDFLYFPNRKFSAGVLID